MNVEISGIVSEESKGYRSNADGDVREDEHDQDVLGGDQNQKTTDKLQFFQVQLEQSRMRKNNSADESAAQLQEQSRLDKTCITPAKDE